MFFRSALLIAGATFAVAQNISNQCSSTLLAVASSPSAACLDLSLLAPLGSSNAANTSIIPTVNSWLSGACSRGPCSNATLQQVVTNITSGCSSDLAGLGLSTSDTSTLVATVQAFYPTVRQVVCLQDTSASSLCVTEELTAIQTATNTTLSLTNIITLISKAMSGTDLGIPQNVTCSNCAKAAYNIITQNFPSVASSAQAGFQSTCGANFTDGQMPSNIKETASNTTNTTPTSTGAAAPLSVSGLGVGVAILVAVSSVFATFA